MTLMTSETRFKQSELLKGIPSCLCTYLVRSRTFVVVHLPVGTSKKNTDKTPIHVRDPYHFRGTI